MNGNYTKVFIFLLIVAVGIVFSSSQVMAGCCTGPSQGDLGCLEETDAAACSAAGGTYSAEACENLTMCINEVCCFNPTTCVDLFGSKVTEAKCGANYNVSVDASQTCTQNLCEGSIASPTPYYNVTGTVVDQNGAPVEGAYVHPALIYTPADGTFSFPLEGNRSYSFSAIKVGECDASNTFIRKVESNINIQFNLTCSNLTGWNCNDWSDCVSNSQSRTCNPCTGTECDVYQETRPAQTSGCIPQLDEDYCKTHGDFSRGEECTVDEGETLYNNGAGFTDVICGGCIATSCKCALLTTCGNGRCDAGEDCDSCTGVGNDCVSEPWCASDCDTKLPEEVYVNPIIGRPNATITWSFDNICIESLEYFYLEWCNDKGCGNTVVTPVSETQEDYVFITPALDELSEYTFTLFKKSPTAYVNVTAEPDPFLTGDEDCMYSEIRGTARTFCGEDGDTSARFSCDDMNFLTNTSCPNDQACYTDAAGIAICKTRAPCDSCNGIYQGFGSFNWEVNFLVEGIASLASATCEVLADEYNNNCYYDKTPKTVNKYYDCADVNSCYEFRSEDVCTALTCKRNDTIGLCDWGIYEEEFDAGICRPQTTEFQDCSKCNDENGVFVSCTPELCPLFGDLCYYKMKGVGYYGKTTQACIGPGTGIDMGCDYYNTQTDCVAADGIAQEATLDTATNVLTKSLDKLAFGTCDFNSLSNVCMKDANDDDEDDCGPIRFLPGGALYLRCYADNQPPVSTFSITDGNKVGRSLSTFFVTAHDNEWGLGEEFSIPIDNNKKGVDHRFRIDTMPDGEFISWYDLTEYLKHPVDTPSGTHTLSFYARDYASNYEEVQNVEVELLDQLTISIQNPVYSGVFDDALGVFLNDVNITFNVNRPTLRCEGTLEGKGGDPTNLTIPFRSFDTRHTAPFTGISNKAYTFSVWCEDAYGTGYATRDFTVENNNLIFDVKPRFVVYNETTPVRISLQTNETAECRLSQNQTRFDNMLNDFTTSDGTHHTFNRGTQKNGAYLYFTACKSSENLIESLEEDLVLFSVDGKGPHTELIDAYTNETYDVDGSPEQEVRIRFRCTDEDPETKSYNFDTNTTFGCGKVFYSFGPGNFQELSYEYNDPVIHTNYTERDLPVDLYYYSVDKGGNKESEQVVPLKLGLDREDQISIDIKFKN